MENRAKFPEKLVLGDERDSDITFVFHASFEYQDGLHLIVSSEILKSGSKKFIEFAARGPREFLLPWDSAPGMVLLCRILYHENIEYKEIIDIRTLAGLAAAASRRHCIQATRRHVQNWFDHLMASKAGPHKSIEQNHWMEQGWSKSLKYSNGRYCEALCQPTRRDVATVAYLYEFEHSFNKITLSMILHSYGSYPYLADSEPKTHKSVQEVLNLIDKARNKHMSRLASLVKATCEYYSVLHVKYSKPYYPGRTQCSYYPLGRVKDLLRWTDIETPEAHSRDPENWRYTVWRELTLANFFEDMRNLDLEPLNRAEETSEVYCERHCHP